MLDSLLSTSHQELSKMSTHRMSQFERGTWTTKGWFKPRVRPLFINHDILSPRHPSRAPRQPSTSHSHCE